MRTNVYIDGFNLYYAIKHTSYKWLNLSALCGRLLPGHTIQKIYYCTAKVIAFPHDPSAPARQELYFRALRTLPDVEIHDEGHFVQWAKVYPEYPLLYYYPDFLSKPPKYVRVLKPEEKGTDVNIASFLLKDCFMNKFDKAVVISNDSDLATPIKITVNDCGKLVMVINPHRPHNSSRELVGVATEFRRTINNSAYAACQFNSVLTDISGTFTKPSSW